MDIKKTKNRKGQLLGQLGGTFQQIAFLGIFGAIMIIILVGLNDTISRGTTSDNQTSDAIANATLSIANVFEQLPLFGTILGLLLIVGIVFLLVRRRDMGGEGSL